jgi:glutaminyl-tRNA synthetase
MNGVTEGDNGSPKEIRPSLNFIEALVEEDLRSGLNGGRVHTRFPPEPNGYLHIGHAKSICLNFGLAQKYGGMCNLRFDDTNPVTEEEEYVHSIREDVSWLGFEWAGEYYASDYFDQLYEWAIDLIRAGKAYVDDQSQEEIAAQRGTPTRPGTESPYRNRSVEENLDLFERMKKGEFRDGSRVLRAKVDMASPNMHLRDPALYRIKKASHHRTGDRWCIYPMYDYAHGQSDYIEGITHSICTLEFEVHRPLYDWFLDQIARPGYRPKQIEFARLNLSYTVMSKRKLLQLVEEGLVNGWDDPRMPTISGLRRRGYTPQAIRNFADRVGVARRENIIDLALLEYNVREDLNRTAPRRMAVLQPLKVVLINFPEERIEQVMAINNPEDPSAGRRPVPFCRELWIEREDFMEDPPKKFHRLSPGGMVRLKYAWVIRCVEVVRDPATGEIAQLNCEYLPDTLPGGADAGIKVKGNIHWVSARHAVRGEVRMYDRLFSVEDPTGDPDRDFKEFLNPDSLKIVRDCCLEQGLDQAGPLEKFQFERKGYFCADPDSRPAAPVFNLTVTLRDAWARLADKEG